MCHFSLGTTVKSHSNAQQNHREEASQVSFVLAEEGRRQTRIARGGLSGGICHGRKLQELFKTSLSVSMHALTKKRS